MGAMADRLYFRQLLSGRDLAAGDQLARQMVNFVYLVGDRDTGEAVVVDPAHVGGSMMGFSIRGVSDLLEKVSVPIHVQAAEADYVCKTTGLTRGDLVTHASGDTVTVGGIDIELIHTPGHTPGSQCFMVENRLVSGDTLFLEGCGRTDLPGSDPREMYESLTQRLAKVPDDALLFPGHWYAPEPSGSMGETRRSNYVFAPRSEAQWLQMFGGI
jgi:glyoxylase-like metal-dependent hydrolase (beta-lactamase superfamily II)